MPLMANVKALFSKAFEVPKNISDSPKVLLSDIMMFVKKLKNYFDFVRKLKRYI